MPVAAAALVAVVNLEHELRQQATVRLHQSAKEYGLDILQRLVAVKRESLLTNFSDSTALGRPKLPYRLVSAGPEMPAALESDSTGASDASTRHGTNPRLVRNGDHETFRLYMVFDGPDRKVLDIDPGYVWGPAEYMPVRHLCVTESGGSALFCSTPTASSLLAVRKFPDDQSLSTIELDGRSYLGYSRQLFLPSEFEAPEWTVSVFQNERQVLSPAASFKYLFAPAVLALIAGALLLGIVQIRRRLEPLDRLIAGTHRVAAQDFDTRIDVNSGDEFEDLADAFNEMTQTLGKQINTLKTLSSIDKTILRTLDPEAVAAFVLKTVNGLGNTLAAAVVTVDRDSPDFGHVHLLIRGVDDIRTSRRRMEFEELDWTQHRKGTTLDLTRSPSVFDPLRESGALLCFAVPFFSEDQLDGVLCLAIADPMDLDLQTRKAMEDFADRLAVTASVVKKERMLQQQANYDALTGLPNRLLLRDRLDRALLHAGNTDSEVAILFLDLDRFKTVNDTMGHTSGDELLAEAAQRLVSCVSDSDTVARLGGDEFVVLLPDLGSPNRIVATAGRILNSIAEPFGSGERKMLLGASIGIATFPRDGRSSEDLLRHADTAMYEAKKDGRGRYYFFDHEMNRRLEHRARMESDLWRAVQADELELWYQPQLDLTDRRIRGAEALIRWRHPERGIVRPEEFIPLAEELGLIESIGARVLDLACRDFNLWYGEGFTLDRIAVNVSPREFSRSDYVSRVAETLRRYDLPPLRLVLEITENLLVHDTERIGRQLNQLRDLGVSFSIDDFGIGYSSLSYLQKLPIDTLKIDRSFIQDITTNEESRAIVDAILDMARRLNLEVVAEGVETPEQLDYLQASGCRQIQGFIYSRPLRPNAFLAFLKTYTV